MNQNAVDNTNDTDKSNLLSSPTTTSNQNTVDNTTDKINNGDDLELSDPQDFSTERTEAPTEQPSESPAPTEAPYFVLPAPTEAPFVVLPPLRPNEDVPAVIPELPAHPAEDWFSHDFDSHDGTATTSSSSSGVPLEGFVPVAAALVLGLAILFMVFNCVRWHNRQDGRNKRRRNIPYGHDTTTNTTVMAHACAFDTSAPMATAVAIGDGGVSSGGGFSGGGDCGGGGGF